MTTEHGPYWTSVYVNHWEFRKLFRWEQITTKTRDQWILVKHDEFAEWLDDNGIRAWKLFVRDEEPGDEPDPTWDRAKRKAFKKTGQRHILEKPRKVRFMKFTNPTSAVLFKLRWCGVR